MGDDQKRFTTGQLCDSFLNFGLILWISKRCGLVQNHDGSILQNSPGDCNTLSLTTRQPVSSLACAGLIPLFQLVDKFVALCLSGRLQNLLICGLRIAQPDIFQNGAVKQKIILRNKTHLIGQLCQRNVFDIYSTNPDSSLCRIPETCHQAGQCRFTSTRRADKSIKCPLRDSKIYVMDYIFFSGIGEGHMLH